MYVNERDQINYHGFLRALREMHKLPQECVSKGICSKSGMNRFENGNRVAEKLTRDRLTARLGISGEKYEDYLQPREYAFWEQRLRIVKAIEKRDLVTAKKELSAYEQRTGLNRVNLQFTEAMRYMILSLEDAVREELEASIQKAVKYTVSNVSKALEGAHLLADQEINLIAEQIRLSSPKKGIRDVNAWRVAEYEKLLSYMDASKWENLQMAKVYPKVVYYICQCLLEKETTEVECRRGLELCHTAIELLRDTSRLYYFIELTESRRELAARLFHYDIPADEKSQLEEMLAESNEWEKVFKELYTEYKVAPYMSDFCYLYYETECHNMATVIETRRNMLGLSRAKLSDNICAERTIIRLEREDYNPSIDTVRNLFERMGMCAEYRRARVITNDVNALMLIIEVSRNMNDSDFVTGEINIQKLQGKLLLGIPCNQQVVKRQENRLELGKGQLSKALFYDKMREALEYTIPLKSVLSQNKVYLTREEIMCVSDLAFIGDGKESEKCQTILEAMCLDIDEEKMLASKICMYEFIADHVSSHMGDVGRFSESIELSKVMLKECLKHRRMVNIWTNIYNILWNETQHNDSLEGHYTVAMLEKCVLLCKLIKEYNTAAFFQNKIDNVFY